MPTLDRPKVLITLLVCFVCSQEAGGERAGERKAGFLFDTDTEGSSLVEKGQVEDQDPALESYSQPMNVHIPKFGTCPHCKIGFSFAIWPSALYIDHIYPDGQLAAWNNDPNENRQVSGQVQVGDLVTSVNAVSGDGQAMHVKIYNESDLWLSIIHVPAKLRENSNRLVTNMASVFAKIIHPEMDYKEIQAQLKYNILSDPEVNRRMNIAKAADFNRVFSDYRTGHAAVVNRLGHTINNVLLFHKYSDVYKNVRTWESLVNDETSPALTVEYETGTLSTGWDWWFVAWESEGQVFASDPWGGKYRDEIEPWVPTALGMLLGHVGEAHGVPHIVGSIVGDVVGHSFTNTESTAGFKSYSLNDWTGDVDIVLDRGGQVKFEGKNPWGSKMTSIRKHTPWRLIGNASKAEIFEAAEKVENGQHINIGNIGSFRKMWNQLKALTQAVKAARSS